MFYKPGLKVEFNGHKYVLIDTERKDEYAIGMMACELKRLDICSIKDIILRNPYFQDIPDRKQMMEAADWLRNAMLEAFSPIISEMVYAEFVNGIMDFYLSDDDEYKSEYFMNLNALCTGSEFWDFVFRDTDYKDVGDQTIGQFSLSMYLMVEMAYRFAMHAFDRFLCTEDKGEKAQKAYSVYRMSRRDSYLQDIDYYILFYDDQFNSVFKIRTMMSLCIFEMAHIYEGNIPVVKCRNCGQYFVPRKRSDACYCDYPAPDGSGKTCKEIGAQNAWKNKVNTDDAVKAYRKVYMRYKMKVNRHPEDIEAQEQLQKLTEGNKEWKKKIAADAAAKPEYIRWLETF